MFDLLELQQLMIHETSPEYRKQFAVVDTYMTRLERAPPPRSWTTSGRSCASSPPSRATNSSAPGCIWAPNSYLLFSQPPARIPRP